MVDEKLCPRCNENWPADTDFFYADATSADGLFYCCKACHTTFRDAKRQSLHVPRVSDALAQLNWIEAGL